MPKNIDDRNGRTEEQIRRHYELERRLADRLRHSSREERKSLYSALYDELFLQVPDHPQITRKCALAVREAYARRSVFHLKRFLNASSTFMEIGPGDCAVSFEIAKLVNQVYAIDVSAEITKSPRKPRNFRLFITDGSSMPVPPATVDVCYSNQLMEHLHPDDAKTQLMGIYNALKPGGLYICATPNRLTGPHDVSRYLDEVATGFHLKEYTRTELRKLFLEVGFSRVDMYVMGNGPLVRIPATAVLGCEKLLGMVKQHQKKKIGRMPIMRSVLGTKVVGVKLAERGQAAKIS